MPFYVYACRGCSNDITLQRAIAERENAPVCLGCNRLMDRKITAPNAYVDGPGGGTQAGWLKR